MVVSLDLSSVVDVILAFIGGPVGIFLVSMVSNSIPFVTVPYLGIVAGYSFIYTDPISRVVMILSSAAGAATGKIVVYFLGRAFRRGLGEYSRKNIELFKKVARRSLFIAIVVFASTPLPDDILYIPLGLMKYPLPQYVLAIFAGKAVLTSIVVAYASWITAVAATQVYTVPILIVVTVLLTYLILRIDWYNVINTLYGKGLIPACKVLLKEVMVVMRGLVTRRRSNQEVKEVKKASK